VTAQEALENTVAALRLDGAVKDANASLLRCQLQMERATVADLKKSVSPAHVTMHKMPDVLRWQQPVSASTGL
jgi:hypothetical protein